MTSALTPAIVSEVSTGADALNETAFDSRPGWSRWIDGV
jgi:hypothetical protein